MQITTRDFFIMPLFDANWPSLVVVILTYLATRKWLFKNQKFSFIYSIVVIFYSVVATLPLQSLAALKLWQLKDETVLKLIFPLCAFICTLPCSYLLLKMNLKVRSWWEKRKQRRNKTTNET